MNYIRTHSGEKPYQCEDCRKRFSESGSLVKHMRIHTSEKPYPCGVRDKRFRDLSTINDHLCRHVAHPEFYCFHCELCFKLLFSPEQVLEQQSNF